MISIRHAAMAIACLLPSLGGWAAPAATNDPVNQLSVKFFREADRFWAREFLSLGGQYRRPELSWYSKEISDVCNLQGTLSGPFYCPISQRVYLDRFFLDRLAMHSPSSRAAVIGYVVAHEVAHHVQGIIGTTALVDQARANSTPELANQALTKMELQTDCYTGLWLRSAAKRGLITLPADISMLLDDMATFGREWQTKLPAGQVMPDPLDQGSAAQRLKWVRRGMDSGNFNDCDTFGIEPAGDK